MVNNSSATATASGNGVGFSSLLTILFIALKLTGVITWSWWWVLSPLWITAGLLLAVVVCLATVAIGLAILAEL